MKLKTYKVLLILLAVMAMAYQYGKDAAKRENRNNTIIKK